MPSPYGGSNYGIESASRNFFGKNASDISLAEAAYLASLTKAPTYYSPYGNHQEELARRKDLVLNKMAELGFIAPRRTRGGPKEKGYFLGQGAKLRQGSSLFRLYPLVSGRKIRQRCRGAGRT